MTTYKFRYYKGVKYVAPHKAAPNTFSRCGHCRRAWDDSRSTELTPTPSGRCPFEYWHRTPQEEKRSGYTIEPETFAGEKPSPASQTGRYALSFRGNWIGTYATKREAERKRAAHKATIKSQHELAQARLRDINAGKCG